MIDFEKIEFGLKLLLSVDGYLLEKVVSERAITHKLGEYLQKLYPEWNVDCEFNKNLDGEKIININYPELLRQMCNFLEINFNSEELMGENFPLHLKESLLEQLHHPQTEYIQDLDLLLFHWESDGDKTTHAVYPDIIIHHRGTVQNHIVIEAKKSTNTNNKDKFFDLIKLATLVSSAEYKYNRGIFIDLPAGHDYKKFKSFIRTSACFTNVFKYEPQY